MDKKIGISDLAFYIPPLFIRVEEIIAQRIKVYPNLERRLRRALGVTGQVSLHFPYPWQDAATLAAQAARNLFQQGLCQAANLRYVATGSESSVDMSKPISAYVEGMLQRSGIPLPHNISTFQVQHACAGGTIALLSVAALLQVQSEARGALVCCSDIARYKAATTAELSQGAGAVALFVEQNPKLMILDLGNMGVYSEDVDDFFRPLTSCTAEVQGRYSIECYMNAVEAAFLDYCHQCNMEPSDLLQETDFFVLHVPFPKMAYMGIHRLFSKFLHLGADMILSEAEHRGFSAMTDVAAHSGNIYNGSIYLALRALLKDRYKKYGAGIVGKKILSFSYGSGNTMLVFRATLCEEAPRVIENWDAKDTDEHIPADIDQYEQWMQQSDARAPQSIPNAIYYLKNIRDDGYREYSYEA